MLCVCGRGERYPREAQRTLLGIIASLPTHLPSLVYTHARTREPFLAAEKCRNAWQTAEQNRELVVPVSTYCVDTTLQLPVLRAGSRPPASLRRGERRHRGGGPAPALGEAVGEGRKRGAQGRQEKGRGRGRRTDRAGRPSLAEQGEERRGLCWPEAVRPKFIFERTLFNPFFRLKYAYDVVTSFMWWMS